MKKINIKKCLKNVGIFTGGAVTMFVITCMIGAHIRKTEDVNLESTDDKIFKKLEELKELAEKA